MKTFINLVESIPSKTIVFAFGRCNPFTSGHLILASKLLSKSSQLRADHEFILSKTQDKKKNPLSPDKKLYWAKRISKNTNFKLATDESPSFLHFAKIYSGKYKNLIMIAGSDRVDEYLGLLNKYNGKDFNFDSISVISAGERDPDSDDISGMSASKIRALASEGSISKFINSLDLNLSKLDMIRYMNDIRDGLGLNLIKEHINISNNDELREKYYSGNLFKVGQFVTCNNELYEILELGSNYVNVINENRQIKKMWVKDLNESNDSFNINYYTSKNITENIENSFILSENSLKNGEFSDKFALILAFQNIDKYYQTKDINFAIKCNSILENINQLHNHPYIKEILEMSGPPKSDYESIDGVSIDNTHDNDANSIENASDEELEHIIKTHLHDDDYFNEYDEEDFCVVDSETGEEVELESPDSVNEEALNEVLSRIERMRSSIRFHRTEAKRNRKLEIALRKRSDNKTLNKRARRLAVKALERRLAKKPLSSLTISEKERIEQRISRMKPVLSRLAMRLIPKVKKLESDRLSRKSEK